MELTQPLADLDKVTQCNCSLCSKKEMHFLARGSGVPTPDLFDGRRFDTIEEGMAFAREAGFGALAERGVTAISLDAIPRTLSRAQTMDALSIVNDVLLDGMRAGWQRLSREPAVVWASSPLEALSA